MDLTFDNLSDAIFHYAKTKPNHPAIVDGSHTLTYRELAKEVNTVCVYLQTLGIGENDHVGLILDNHIDHIMLMFALMRIGATPIEMSTEMQLPMQNELINDLNMRAIFVECTCKAGKNVPIRVVVNIHWRSSLKPNTKNTDVRSTKQANENKIVMLTSGTTGKPKSIVSTHQQRLNRVNTHAHLLRDAWSVEKPGNALITIPLTHAGPHQFLINQLIFGGTVHILPKLSRTSDVIRAFGAYDNLVSFVTVSISRALLANRDEQTPFLPNAQALISGGLALTAAEKLAMRQYITPHFYESYGASGFGFISGLTPEEVTAKPGSVGKPLCEIEIVNAQDEKVPVGAIGHIRCKGNTRAEGYLTPNNSSTELFRGQWYYPGDMGCFDKEGYLFLKGRQADIIHSNGIEIYPAEIEEILMNHPSVEEAAVIGLRVNQQQPYKPVAVVVPREGKSLTQLPAYCVEQLPAEKRPVKILRTAYIAKTTAGKIDRASVIKHAISRLSNAQRSIRTKRTLN